MQERVLNERTIRENLLTEISARQVMATFVHTSCETMKNDDDGGIIGKDSFRWRWREIKTAIKQG